MCTCWCPRPMRVCGAEVVAVDVVLFAGFGRDAAHHASTRPAISYRNYVAGSLRILPSPWPPSPLVWAGIYNPSLLPLRSPHDRPPPCPQPRQDLPAVPRGAVPEAPHHRRPAAVHTQVRHAVRRREGARQGVGERQGAGVAAGLGRAASGRPGGREAARWGFAHYRMWSLLQPRRRARATALLPPTCSRAAVSKPPGAATPPAASTASCSGATRPRMSGCGRSGRRSGCRWGEGAQTGV